MLLLLNDILDVEKMERNELALEHTPFDARACVEACVALFACKCESKGVELCLDYAVDASLVLVGDAGRFKQVVTNLLSNASKFTQTGYVAVRVWVCDGAEVGFCGPAWVCGWWRCAE
jgi:signal transduction histidine kinase